MTIFSQEQLNTLVADTLPLVPDGHTSAIVGTVDQSGAQVVVAFKSQDDKWIATGALRHDWAGETQVGASVIYSW